MEQHICFNGEIHPIDDVKISPINRGMMYGDGCFETFRSYSGQFLGFKQHYRRLMEALQYLNIELSINYSHFSQLIQSLLLKNELNNNDAVIRIQCWRQGERGYETTRTGCDWMITANSLISLIFPPLHLITAETRVIPNSALDRSYKLANGLNYIVAARESEKQHADDALMLTMNNYISETTKANIFWGTGNTIKTPSLKCDLLPGVTRGLVLEMLSKTKYAVEEGVFTLNDLKKADFIFATNSISEIRAVEKLDDHHFDANHPELNHISSMFEVLKQMRLT